MVSCTKIREYIVGCIGCKGYQNAEFKDNLVNLADNCNFKPAAEQKAELKKYTGEP